MFQNVRFQNVWFQMSEMSGLQNVRFTKRQVYKTSGLQNVRFTKCQVFKTSGCKKLPYILYSVLVVGRNTQVLLQPCLHVCMFTVSLMLSSSIGVTLKPESGMWKIVNKNKTTTEPVFFFWLFFLISPEPDTQYRKFETNIPRNELEASVPMSTFLCLWAIYIFPRSVCLFCGWKICWPILGI